MIQRIQTVYLIIAGILLAIPVMLELSLATVVIDGGEYRLSPVTASLVTDAFTDKVFGSFTIAAAFALSLFLTVYAVMQYKNRKFQMRLVQLALFLQPVIGVVVFFYADKLAQLAEGGTVNYQPVLAVLVINVVLYVLALKGIKKDDELVRSADRLR